MLELGKLLVQELNLDPGVDTLSRWMAYYVAEQITLAETAQGAGWEAAQQRAFDTVLSLWKHRHTLPRGRRSLASFEQLFAVLTELNPDGPEEFYIVRNDGEVPYGDQAGSWMRYVLTLDRATRTLIEIALQQMALQPASDLDEQVLECAGHLEDAHDVRAVQWLRGRTSLVPLAKTHLTPEQVRQRIGHLEQFVAASPGVVELALEQRSVLLALLVDVTGQDLESEQVEEIGS